MSIVNFISSITDITIIDTYYYHFYSHDYIVPDLIIDISWGKGTAQKDATKDITSDSQVNSYMYFLYRWSPASLTLSSFSTYFLCLYTT